MEKSITLAGDASWRTSLWPEESSKSLAGPKLCCVLWPTGLHTTAATHSTAQSCRPSLGGNHVGSLIAGWPEPSNGIKTTPTGWKSRQAANTGTTLIDITRVGRTQLWPANLARPSVLLWQAPG